MAQLVRYFYLKHLDRQTCVNSANPGQTPPNAESDLGLYCLHLIYQFLDTAIGSEMGLLKRQDKYIKVSRGSNILDKYSSL